MSGAQDLARALAPQHSRELEQASAIDQAVIVERGYRTLDWRDREELARLGISVHSAESFPGLLLPLYRATGESISAQFKPAKPITPNGRAKPIKYLSPRGQGNRIDVHPRNHPRITDITVPLWITEGLKKADSLTSHGCCVAAITGVYNWRSKLATLGDWEDIPLKGREIVLCFDADAKKNMNVARAMVRLGRWCDSKGARQVRYLIVPREVNNTTVKGVDDYFAAGGTLENLLAAAATAEPDTETCEDTFSDARLAETIAEEVLADRLVWCKALGWLRWSGHRWVSVTENRVGEAVRQHVLLRFGEAVKRGNRALAQGWQAMLAAGRQGAVLHLAKGIVEHDADEFDAEPDMFNTPAGVVNLRTGQVLSHDPDLLLTKIARGNYRPGYTHPDWDQALTSICDDARTWLRERVGQAITGHPTSDGLIVIAQGSGENGKTVIFGAAMQAFGDYAAPCSPKLFASSKDEHSTERADLRSQRLLVAEELTEDRALNITAIKRVTDVVEIRARHVHKDNMTFRASHSLFITTNYVPVVNETDHGTWRRLALLAFPFTFRKTTEATAGPSDRRGDARLKERLKDGHGGQHDAIVTWAVEGARRWYESGFSGLPTSVEADTRAWRKAADRILGFWDDVLVADENACVTTPDMLEAFNAWMKANGHHEWPKELFGSRFKAHAETKRHGVEERRPRNLDDLDVSRPCGAVETLPGRPYVYLGVRFRRPGEIDENIEENARRSKRSDRSGNSPYARDPEKSLDRSDRSDQGCCEGGALVLSCRLCPKSPTYWQRAAIEGLQ